MVSVIVPFYNAQQWLDRCLHSLHIQANAEFIIVNDHSTDNGIEIAYDYCNKDKRFTLLNNHTLHGVSGARNTGIEYASGDYITFLDADDEMLPNAIKIYNKLNTANIYQTNHLRYYAKTERTVRKYAEHSGERSLTDIPKCWCMVWNKLYRRDFIGDIRFNEHMNFGEDELFNLDCLDKDSTIHCVEVDTIKRHFDNASSLSRIKSKDDLFKQAKELMKFIDRTNNNELKAFTCRLLSEHWSSENYLKAITPRSR